MIYKMDLKDSVDTMTFNLLETPIVDKDIEGAVDNVTLDGNQYTDYLYLKKQYIQKWAIMCPDEYDEIRGFYTRQFEEGEVPSYRVYYGANVTRDYTLNGDYLQFNAEGIETGMTLSQLLGNAEQTTYSGKNLLPPTADWTQTVSGVTVTCSNGQYTFSGTSTANGSTTARATVAQYTIQSGDYFHYDNTLVSDQINIQYLFTDNTYFATSMNVANRVVPLEPYVGKTIASCRVNFASGSTFNGVAKPMILHNVSTVADYEPYVGGIPAPNPSYPQPISTVTGAQTVTVTGKNLFNFQEFAQDKIQAGGVIRGVATATGDSITITATENDAYTRVDFAHGYPPTIRVKNNTDYVLSWKTDNTSGTNMGVVYVFARGSNNQNIIVGYRQDTAGSFQFNTGAYSEITFRFGVATSGNSITYSNIMLEYGSQPSGYKPYDGTQSYEVNLGKNLLPPTADWTQTVSGVTITCSNGQYTFSGTATANGSTTARATIAPYTIQSGDYFHYGNTLVSESINIQVVFTDATYFASSMNVANRIYSLESYVGKTIASCRVNFASGNTFNGVAKPMIVHNTSTQTSFAPYFTPIELAKIGTYQDRIYKDDGKWYIEKQVGKTVITTENASSWSLNSTSYAVPMGYCPKASLGLKTGWAAGVAITNRYSEITSISQIASGKFGTDFQQSNFTIFDSSFTDTTTMRTNLVGTEIYIALATPTTTEITDETLLLQLNFLASLYEGENNISLVGTGAQGEMEVFIRDVMSVETDVVPEVPVRLTLTDDGVINACGCRRNVQLTMRETTE